MLFLVFAFFTDQTISTKPLEAVKDIDDKNKIKMWIKTYIYNNLSLAKVDFIISRKDKFV